MSQKKKNQAISESRRLYQLARDRAIEEAAKLIERQAEWFPTHLYPPMAKNMDGKCGTLARHLAKVWAAKIRTLKS